MNVLKTIDLNHTLNIFMFYVFNHNHSLKKLEQNETRGPLRSPSQTTHPPGHFALTLPHWKCERKTASLSALSCIRVLYTYSACRLHIRERHAKRPIGEVCFIPFPWWLEVSLRPSFFSGSVPIKMQICPRENVWSIFISEWISGPFISCLFF